MKFQPFFYMERIGAQILETLMGFLQINSYCDWDGNYAEVMSDVSVADVPQRKYFIYSFTV